LKKNSSKAVSMLFASLLLIGFLGLITSHTTYALQNTMTFTTGDTINFSSTNETTFWSNVTMRFGTGVRIQFVETVPNGYLQPCDVIQIIWPVGFQATPCSWWEVLDPLGNPTGIEFHIDGQYGPYEFHVDQVIYHGPPPAPLPPQPVTAELKIQVVEPCDYFVVHWPKAWYPPECSWWEIMDPETGLPTGFEFHVDWNNQSCEFHVDQVLPQSYYPPIPGVYEIEARQKITSIKPCDWFVVLDPTGLVPSPCSWWSVWSNGMPLSGRFHVDSVNGRAFHVDQANPNPIDLSSSPEYPTTARQNIAVLTSCRWYKVDDLAATPKPCSWWEVLTSGMGGTHSEFHVDVSFANNGTFHVDTVLPDNLFYPPVQSLTAEMKLDGLGPCDWFQVANPQGWLPEPCSWWKITWPTQWAGVSFHVDSTDGVSKFHVDAADALPPGPTPPPWNVTAVRVQPPSGPWYVKPAYPDYAPSGMPDFDENQDAWGPAPGTFTWCGPVAVANSLWWLDSEFESILNPNPWGPPAIIDNFNLVSAWGNWDDHDVKNVDPLVHNLAFWMDTDGQRSLDGHIGTRWQDMQWGINQYLMQQGVAGMFEVHNMTYPQFQWIESEIEKCQDVVLFLEFWQWTGSKWVNNTMTNPSLESGHFVTCAGVNSTSNQLLISDPYQDAFEAGTAPGRSPVPEPYPHPSSAHNDTQYVSQDAYQVLTWSPPPVPPPPPPPFPQPAVELVGYMPGYYTFITAAVVTSPLLVADVAVTNLTSPKTVVFRGYCDNLTVTAKNLGNFSENFNVAVYANTTTIATLNFNLASGSNATQPLLWNTSGFAYGNYTLNAVADTVPGETNTTNNSFTDGRVRMSIVGDLTGRTPNAYDFVPDGKVDVVDVAVVAHFFNQKVPPAPGNCDVSGPTLGMPDGKIDISDVALVAKHFGEHE
jgi:hypothetical protein